MQIELIAKTLICNSDGAVLVLRRHDNDMHRPGGWDLPGGQVELGEDPKHAALREAQEETGLQLRNLHPVHVTSRIYGNRQVVKTIFTTNTYTGIPTLSHEHSELRWLPADEFSQLAISSDYAAAAKCIHTKVAVDK